MLLREPTLLLDGLCFPEGPRWHKGRLFFSDMYAREVVAVDLQGKRETIARVEGRPSGLGFGSDGRLRVVSMVDRRLLVIGDSGPSTVAELSALSGGPCNDMVLDAHDRAYVGNFGFSFEYGEAPRPASLALVEANGSARLVADELVFPNGCAITPDGRTLIVAETFARRLTRFAIAPDGSLHDRRVFAELSVLPDGICLDAEGCVWVASPAAPGGFLRVAEGGEVLQRIELPDRFGYACMLGGPERRTLFLLEAFTSLPDRALPGNGRIRSVDVDVPGAGYPTALEA
ncbi:MAG: SMP-30/gluconolactonase/LRE family protein [Deltaproteobacteria bacterium]|nr:SMP-30/gluconolactonase/LRE family protein [Deltaproteobacteria bacterium]